MIDSSRVSKLFMECMFNDVEDAKIHEPVIVEGIKIAIGLHPQYLEEHKSEINDIIDQLPTEFSKGFSFLGLSNDINGNQWTGMHQVMEQILLLGLAIKRMEYCAPKELWSSLPGGMPYLFILDREEINGLRLADCCLYCHYMQNKNKSSPICSKHDKAFSLQTVCNCFKLTENAGRLKGRSKTLNKIISSGSVKKKVIATYTKT